MKMFNGFRVIANPILTKTITTKIHKPWWMRLADTMARWNPCNEWNNPDYKFEEMPSSEVIIVGNNLYAHPAVIEQMRTHISVQSAANFAKLTMT